MNGWLLVVAFCVAVLVGGGTVLIAEHFKGWRLRRIPGVGGYPMWVWAPIDEQHPDWIWADDPDAHRYWSKVKPPRLDEQRPTGGGDRKRP